MAVEVAGFARSSFSVELEGRQLAAAEILASVSLVNKRDDVCTHTSSWERHRQSYVASDVSIAVASGGAALSRMTRRVSASLSQERRAQKRDRWSRTIILSVLLSWLKRSNSCCPCVRPEGLSDSVAAAARLGEERRNESGLCLGEISLSSLLLNLPCCMAVHQCAAGGVVERRRHERRRSRYEDRGASQTTAETVAAAKRGEAV